MKTAPEGLSLGRLRASACSRLPGNHSAGQGSRKPRRRIHGSGSLRRLASGHTSMVSRQPEPGQLYFPAYSAAWVRRRLQDDETPSRRPGAELTPGRCRDETWRRGPGAACRVLSRRLDLRDDHAAIAILATAWRAASAVTPAPREQAGSAGRIIVGRNTPYQG